MGIWGKMGQLVQRQRFRLFGESSEIYRKSAISGLIRYTALNYDVMYNDHNTPSTRTTDRNDEKTTRGPTGCRENGKHDLRLNMILKTKEKHDLSVDRISKTIGKGPTIRPSRTITK
jgi:hypothetical protein